MNTPHEDSSGQFVLHMQKLLLQHCLAPWPRRGRALLEINCGQGMFLPLLWECGFDVTATEAAPEPRAEACRVGARAEVLAAADDHLPFEDAEFDWVVLHLTSPSMDTAEQALREALRVAAAGLIVTFWNAASLPFMLHRLKNRKTPWPEPAFCWWQVWKTLHGLAAGNFCGASALAGPQGTWLATCPLAGCNRVLPWLPLGSWGGIRVDLARSRPVTPLPLRLGRRRLPRPEPALECGHKSEAETSATEREAL